MEVVIDTPPLFDLIAAKFNITDLRPTILFAWGTKIYSPAGLPIPAELHDHEIAHGKRQGTSEYAVRRWWHRYLDEPVFRLDEEIIGHKAEYRSLCEQTKDRNVRARFLLHVSKKLSAPLYGSLISISEAMRLLRK